MSYIIQKQIRYTIIIKFIWIISKQNSLKVYNNLIEDMKKQKEI